MGERELLGWFRKRLDARDPTVLAGAGLDDCAHLRLPEGQNLIVTADTLLEGTHFLPQTDPVKVGWKTVAVNLSDLAASGARPLWAVVGLGVRRGLGDRWVMRLTEGMLSCCRRYGLHLVGGDVTGGDGPSSITLTAMGVPYPGGPLLRGGARPGDILVVSGRLGGSIRGRHLQPEPRLREIEAILQVLAPHAGMDLSDGLALDLARMLDPADAGAVLDEAAIPVSPDAEAQAQENGRPALAHALNDGEDFELLLALAPEDWARLQAAWPPPGIATPLTAVGTVVRERGLALRRRDGRVEPLEARGYEHDLG